MKKLFITILAMLLPMLAIGQNTGPDLCYNYITKGKVAEVIQNPNGKYIGAIEIPEKITHEGEEYTVKKINDEAFSGCSGLKSVTIPSSVTSIGNYAFSGCSGLTSITIPNCVTSIGTSAFQNCTSLSSITIPTSLSSIEDWTFYNCTSLSSITIPNSVTSIGGRAFSDCTNLSSIAIPSNVSSIGTFAFYNCSGLSSITIPNSVTSIGTFAFFACNSLSSITIPNNLSSIRGSAFKNCTGLTSITIPNSVTSIGSSAFYGCTSLSSITVGDKVSIIYDHAFANCQNLSDIYCLAENVPSTDASVFDGSYVENATLHVPTSVLNAYKTATPWSGFGEFVSISGEEMPKCATPTISYEGGKIKFSCETEGVEYVSEVSSVDAGNNNTDEVDITGKITVKVYATKSGYVNSDTATAVIEVPGELKGDLNNDGTVNVADHVELTKIIMNEE